ncbi:hypothetical protein [Sphingobium sp. YC-XJ3]|uniref:hypothetical protein n=1 Tax=Sphingobium sp. YC-XJ3 TaxID=3024245 RepID=UPI0023629A64|nr:hypothetical protein [Sphingobium sp. YC-XJ3]WDA37835.1 hypothetical protein PO876_06550 [Sphingobium sp. YC-XJ3]
MQIETVSKAQIAQDFITTAIAGIDGVSFYPPSTTFGSVWSANAYWPNDLLKGARCEGRGETLEEAIADLRVKLDAAKNAAPVLKTAAECKEAVLNLIREHDAAPASFRDAVDALPVKG